MMRRKLFLLSAAAFLAFCAPVEGQHRAVAATGAAAASRSICDTCACSPDSHAPLTVNCTCTKTKLLIIRDQDAALLSTVRDLTLASCGYVSFPAAGLSASASLARVTVRDMKVFHYTVGLFPALESLSVEDIGELVLDGFGPANRTLRHLTLRRTNVQKLVNGTVTEGTPLRRVLFDRVEVDDIETDALDMAFVGQADDGSAASDGFTMVDSVVKSVQTNGISVRSGAVRFLNSTLENLEAGAIVVDDAVRLSGNRFGVMSGDSMSVTAALAARTTDGGDSPVYVDGNHFRTLPADWQLFKSERPVEFRDNAVENVDLGPFLFGVGPSVRVVGNRFACDCDPRRISVLKLNQVFPGLLPEADSRFYQLLADNHCREPEANTTLAGYRDMLVKEIACKGTHIATAPPPTPSVLSPSQDSPKNGCNTAAMASAAVVVAAASMLLRFTQLH